MKTLEEIIKWMEIEGVTKAELARKCEYTDSLISAVFNGKRNLSKRLLKTINEYRQSREAEKAPLRLYTTKEVEEILRSNAEQMHASIDEVLNTMLRELLQIPASQSTPKTEPEIRECKEYPFEKECSRHASEPLSSEAYGTKPLDPML
ncbi:MAG: helix-turn-helix transcriptional regulator [Akkermansia sp.]